MKRREFGLTFVATALTGFLGAFSNSILQGQEEEEEERIRILLIVGGHSYDQTNLHAMLRDFPNATFDEISIPEKQDMLKPGLSQKYDVLVFHDQSFFELSDAQKTNLELLFGEEGIPTVMLHHSLISHPDFPLFRNLYGAQYLLKETEIDGRVFGQSSYLRPTDVNICIVKRQHPITFGVQDFKINDEVFKNVYYNPHIDVVARVNHPEGDPPAVWSWQYQKTPVLGLIQGDAGGAFNDPNYRKLFYQGVRYIISQKQN